MNPGHAGKWSPGYNLLWAGLQAGSGNPSSEFRCMLWAAVGGSWACWETESWTQGRLVNGI